MRFSSLGLVAAIVFAACGGTTTDLDGGVDSGGGKDSATNDSQTQDVVEVDAAECTPPGGACANPCPSGTVCLKVSGPQPTDLGCTTIPKACNGTATCDCMKDCFCNQGIDQCVAQQDGLLCNNGAVSKRAFKTEIEYVSNEEREDLARETLAIPLATYRYKTEAEGDKRHLGFIIDDQPQTSPAVAGDQTHVDQYGYTSMLLATVQEQQKQLDALKKQVAALQKK
jgi:Chaperone of endosialidase